MSNVIIPTPDHLNHNILPVTIDTTKYRELKRHFNNHFGSLVKIPILQNSTMNYLDSIKTALYPVLIFMNIGVEVGYNWLPPLIEPIMENSTTCTSPIIHKINLYTFEYSEEAEFDRGIFTPNFKIKAIPPPDIMYDLPDMNYQSPIMLEKMYAITTEYFWKIGGFEFDGIEQIELSLKIWLCGGQILKVPCSRVGEVQRYERLTYEMEDINQVILLSINI